MPLNFPEIFLVEAMGKLSRLNHVVDIVSISIRKIDRVNVKYDNWDFAPLESKVTCHIFTLNIKVAVTSLLLTQLRMPSAVNAL